MCQVYVFIVYFVLFKQADIVFQVAWSRRHVWSKWLISEAPPQAI